MLFYKKLLILIFFISASVFCDAQIADTAVARKIYQSKDSVIAPKEENLTFKETDHTKIKDPRARSPRKAAILSAVLPGAGQVYNKKIWKVPIVYAAMGGTAYYFFDNYKIFKQLQLGYAVVIGIQKRRDSTGFNKITNQYVLNAVLSNKDAELQYYRQNYLNDVQYSVVYFFLAWVLNVVDATVDAHLSTFDVNPNLTFKIQPGYSEMAKTNGVSFVLRFK